MIIGGGPAGSAAAYTLARQGRKVCIVDKSEFPRDKLCGGLLTLRSKKLFENIFEMGWDAVIADRARGVNFYFQKRLLNSVRDYQDIAFTHRNEFDEYLIRRAQAAGAVLLLGSALTSIETKQRQVQLANGNTISYKVLIGCDGVYSVVAKALFGKSFDRDKTCFALEMELPQSVINPPIDIPEISFGYINWGYGWIFPKQGTLTVGLAGLYKKNQDIKAAFERYLISKFGYVPDVKMQGHFLPFGKYRKQPGEWNIMLCGDAAGLVDPITGEGIAYAMQSGNLAAKAACKALKYNSPELAYRYYLLDYTKLSHPIAVANLLKLLIFPALANKLFVRVLPQTKSIPNGYFDLLAGEISYDQYARMLLCKLWKRMTEDIRLYK